jgi:hypothetical protein
MILWIEPGKVLQRGRMRDGSHSSTGTLSGKPYSEIRRFVVIREGYRNCICSYVVGSIYMMLEIN